MARLIRDRDPKAVTILMSADQQDVVRVRQAGLGPSMTLVKPLSPSHDGGAPPRARGDAPGQAVDPRRLVVGDPVDHQLGRHRPRDAEALDLLDPTERSQAQVSRSSTPSATVVNPS